MGTGNKPPLGRLEEIELRAYWENEATDFTPWLAQSENLALLSKALNIELEVHSVETGVGPFSADIVCHDTMDNSVVLIENQVEKTDHRHLGQILTYAAGLDAVTLVWIARSFTEEHRAAIDWLNRVTIERVQFFGVVVELWRIGSSAPAPRFHVIAKPNDWSKAVREQVETELSGSRLLYQEFWASFMAHLKRSNSRLYRDAPSKTKHWLILGIGTSGFHLSAVASVQAGWVAAQLVINAENAKDLFEALSRDRAVIERELGDRPDWISRDNVNKCKIRFQREADLNDRASWPQLHAWHQQRLETLDRVFRPRVAALKAEVRGNNAEDE